MRSAARALVRRAGRRYVAGPAAADAAAAVARLRARGLRVTSCFWDVASAPEQVAEAYARTLALLEAGDRLSVKGRALAFRLDLVEPLLADARARGVELHVDALDLDEAERSLALPADGWTLPGRWSRSVADAGRVPRARVVKGQWPGDADPAEGFLAVVDALAGRAGHVSVATHDEALAGAALDRLEAAGTECELELLWGLPFPRRRPAVPVRVYVPWGYGWLPYATNGTGRRDPRTYVRLARDAVGWPLRKRPGDSPGDMFRTS